MSSGLTGPWRGKNMSDPITILEAAYSLAGTEEQWLEGLADAATPSLRLGKGLVGYTYDVTRLDQLFIRATVFREMGDGMMGAVPKIGVSRSENSYLVPILRRAFVDTLARSPAALLQSGLGERRVREYERVLKSFHREWGVVEQFWVNAQDPTYFGVCFIAASSARKGWQPRERNKWQCIAAHLVTAFRIRRQLEANTASRPTTEGAEAVLSPDGRLEHAERPAQGEGARAALQGAVLAMDRARGRLRRQNPDRAIALWRALVAGRWSLLDHFDSDGRRFVIAHRNDAKVPDRRGLTAREQQVLAHAALGESNKVIAYELGLSVSTVATHLARARAKMSLPSQAVLGVHSETK